MSTAGESRGEGPYPSAQYFKPISNDLSLRLFNLIDDPGERADMAKEMPEKIKELKEEYRRTKANIDVILPIINERAAE